MPAMYHSTADDNMTWSQETIYHDSWVSSKGDQQGINFDYTNYNSVAEPFGGYYYAAWWQVNFSELPYYDDFVSAEVCMYLYSVTGGWNNAISQYWGNDSFVETSIKFSNQPTTRGALNTIASGSVTVGWHCINASMIIFNATTQTKKIFTIKQYTPGDNDDKFTYWYVHESGASYRPYFNFSYIVYPRVNITVNWTDPSDLGTLNTNDNLTVYVNVTNWYENLMNYTINVTYPDSSNQVCSGVNITTMNSTFNCTINMTLEGVYTFNISAIDNESWNDSIGWTFNLYDYTTNVTLEDVTTGGKITGFNVTLEGVMYNTSTTLLNIPAHVGVYLWNITLDYYYDVLNLNVTYAGETYKTFTGFYDTILNFNSNYTGQTIYPNCSNENYSSAEEPIVWAVTATGNTTLECSLFGYHSLNVSINTSSLPQNLTINMTPVQLVLVFDQNTSGYVAWGETTNGTDGFTFNSSIVVLYQQDIAIGYVSVVYNDGQQLFEYYNDNNTHVYQELHVEDPDLIQPVKLWDGTQMIEGKIEVYQLVNDTFEKVYSVYTNEEGYAIVLLKDGNVYKFTGSAEGYTTNSQIEYIEPTTETTATRTILVLIEEDTDEEETITYQNTCPGKVDETTVCTITVNSEVNAYEFFFNYTIGGVTATQTNNDVTSATLILTVTDDTEVDVYVDGEYGQSFQIAYLNISNLTTQIGYDPSDRNWIYQDRTTLIAFFIMTIISAVVVGFFIEQKFEGWGLRASIGYVTLLGFIAPILWAVSLIYVVWFVYEHYIGVGG